MIGTGELVIIMIVVLILFGGKKLPEFARSLGKGLREFKKACQGEDDTEEVAPQKQDKKNLISHSSETLDE